MGLRFTTRVMDPVSVQEAIRRAQAPWRLHAGAQTILHEGSVAHIEARGRDRCRSLQEQATAFDAGDAVWMGGLAFDEEHQASGVWHGFPAAAFSLPKRQLRWQDGQVLETTCDAPALPPPPDTAPASLAASTPRRWDGDVAQACQAIRDGTVSKVVLARCDATPPADPRTDLLRLMAAEDGIAFAFDHGASAFYGVSPERLVSLQGRDVATHALAGSGGAGAAQGRKLLDSSKDVLEHELVVQFMHAQLAEAGVRGVQEGTRRLRALRHVQHLETPMTGQAPEGTHILQLVEALHPTPAVCGTPRQASMSLIRRLESFPRGWYAGAVGWFGAGGEGELGVALRCALRCGDRRYLFAGAGIVAGSQPRAEWSETEAKLATLRETS